VLTIVYRLLRSRGILTAMNKHRNYRRINALLISVALFLCNNVAWAHEAELPKDIEGLALQRFADSVYIIQGPQQFPSPETAGFMNNPGFVLTPGGIVVIDPGSSVQIGRLLLKRIREISSDRVIAVFNTHVHGDHWLGNQAVREAYPEVPIYAHSRMIERVEAGEGADWVDNFFRATGGATADSEVVVPGIGLKGGEQLNIGGDQFQIYHTGKAHTDNDIMIEFSREKSIFLGDIVSHHRVQSARPGDSDIAGQIAAIEFILETDNQIFIPGHGSTGGREIALSQLKFLQDLYASVRKYYADGLTDYEMKAGVLKDMHFYKNWVNFEELGLVISYVYLKVEEASF
jgi:glyoxylase-like metal-dependent hydrolase (beta-lactamase superfamily II)